MTAISADQPVVQPPEQPAEPSPGQPGGPSPDGPAELPLDEHLARVRRALVAEFAGAVPARIIEGVVHEAGGRVAHGPVSADEEQLLLHTCRISLQARVDAGRS